MQRLKSALLASRQAMLIQKHGVEQASILFMQTLLAQNPTTYKSLAVAVLAQQIGKLNIKDSKQTKIEHRDFVKAFISHFFVENDMLTNVERFKSMFKIRPSGLNASLRSIPTSSNKLFTWLTHKKRGSILNLNASKKYTDDDIRKMLMGHDKVFNPSQPRAIDWAIRIAQLSVVEKDPAKKLKYNALVRQLRTSPNITNQLSRL